MQTVSTSIHLERFKSEELEQPKHVSTSACMKYLIALHILLLIAIPIFGQDGKLTINEVIALALEKNPSIQEAALETERQGVLRSTAFEIPKTDVSFLYGEYNSLQKDNNVTITQTIPFPTLLFRQHALNTMLVTAAELKENVTKNELTFQVMQAFNELLYLKERGKTYLQQDSLLTHLAKIATLQYKTGEGTLLSQTVAETQLRETKNQADRNAADIQTTLKHLQLLCQSADVNDVRGNLEDAFKEVEIDSVSSLQNPAIVLSKKQVEIAHQQRKVEAARAFPDLRIGYFNQTLIGNQNINGQDVYFGSDRRFQGVQFGLALPLWVGPHASHVKAAGVASEIAQKQQESYQLSVTQRYSQATQELTKNKNSLTYFRSSALQTAEMITLQSKKAYESGEIDYSTLLVNLRQALSIREGYLMALYQYNHSIIILYYLNGNK